ncbi:MAG: DUF1800 domain-containing protein [Saprospiraceae bacterium]|nr:DUF1800 domain-containing protein [Saprospiraceae bacterium]
MRYIYLPLYLLLSLSASGQDVPNYLGGSSFDQIVVTTSSDYQRDGWAEMASGMKTISGEGLDAPVMEASRFLAQAALGADMDEIQKVQEMGIDAWVEEQFVMEPSSYIGILEDLFSDIYDAYLAEGGDSKDFRCRPKWYHTNYAWWEMVVTGEDLLRQRIALALSEILVISKEKSDLENYGYAVASYYDVLIKHAFGNYKDLLLDVTLHPAMGNYLSHLNNPKANPEEFVFPDENYGREFMQLFSVGIHELNQDGTLKTDGNGEPIPTYSDADIAGISAVFTGLGAGKISDCWEDGALKFGLGIRKIDMTVPMIMYPEYHEAGVKKIIGGYEIAAGQDGIQDIQAAITHVFNHPNVGPFLAKRLIQQLVKSNPTPAYVRRVAEVFADNGNGIRGDMQAIIKAILLDDEARSCAALQDERSGKLRSPILRYTHLVRAMDKFSPSGKYWNTGNDFLEATHQHPLHAPSVFNFYQPGFQPNGALMEVELVAPEFQLLNSVTGITYFDVVNKWIMKEELLRHRETGSNREVYLDIYNLMGGARDPEVLINELDILLTHGQLSEDARAILREELWNYEGRGIDLLVDRTHLALYFLLISPDYTIFK